MRVTGSWAGSRAAALGLGLLLAASLLGVVPGAHGERGSQALSSAALPDGRPTVATAPVSHEAVKLRSAESRTYVLEDGGMLTKVFAAPVNFRAGDGTWRAIDTSLQAAQGGYRVAQAGFGLSLPGALGDDAAVRLTRDGHQLSFALTDAEAATAVVDGSRATYRSLRPGLDIHYEVRPSGVKESLMLADVAAAAKLDFALDVGRLAPVAVKSGGVELRDAQGRTVFSIAAPFMRDAAGELSRDVAYVLRRGESGWTLGVRPDRDWLVDPARRFPVEVDPTVYVGAQVDCHIDSGAPSSSLCGDDELEVGWDGTEDHRALLKFDVAGAVPKGARVEEGYVALYATGASASVNKPLSVYRPTRDWSSLSSWQSADGTNAWTAAGGDFDSRVWRTSWLGSNPTGSWGFWAIGELIQDWVDGTTQNQGVLIKDRDNQTLNNRLKFASSEYSNSARHPYLGVTWSPRTGIERQFTFDEQKLSDRLGLSVNVANGNLVQSADDLRIAGTGLDLNVSRHFNNLAKNYTTPSGRKWRISAGGGVMLIPMNGSDRMLIDGSGARHVFHLKPDGSFVSPTGIDATLAVDGAGHKLTFHNSKEVHRFNASGDPTRFEDGNGNAVSFDYLSQGVLDDITDTQGREVDASYDGDGNLESLEDSTGRTWLYDYDQYDRLTTYTDPDGGITRYVYQGPDNLIEIEDSRGLVTKMAYDAGQRVTSIKRGYNRSNGTHAAQTTFVYSSPTAPCGAGDIGKTVMTDPRGKNTTYCYDVELRVTKTVDANGNSRSTTYTANSDVDTATAPGSALTDFDYDSLGNLTSTTEPAGEVTTAEYTNGSHPRLPTKRTTPQGTSSVFAYDAAGNTTAVGDGSSPTQLEATLEYNGQAGGVCADDATTKPGTLRCAIDGEGNQTLYGYDDAGNLTSITPELPLGETTITYDALSRVDTVEDGKGQTASYSYDALDRIVEIDYGDGQTVGFDYDSDGNRVERVDSAHGTSTWAYDVLNRRTADDLPSGSTDYGWDAASNLTSLTDPGGTVTYGYDDANRLTRLAEPGGSCTSPVSLCTTFGYTSRDRRERTTYPNGVEQTVTLDASDKPTRIRAVKGATVLTDFAYDYEEPSPGTRQTKLRQSVTDKDGNETTYGYDFMDRLTSAVRRDSSNAVLDDRSYAYDLASNRTEQVVNGATTSYGYGAANQLCWTYGGMSSAACGSPPSGATAYSYDANGNTTASSAGLDFDYDDRAQVPGVVWPGGDAALGFGGAEPSAAQAPLTGADRHDTLLGLSRIGTTSWTRDPDGILISQRADGGTRHHYLSDSLGSIVGLVDDGGAVTRSYAYDPFGKVTATEGATPNPFQFAGQYREPEGDVYKVGAHYYAPGLGRWAQPDPLDRAGDLRDGNRYVYAGSDPVNLLDVPDEPDDTASERFTEFVPAPDPEPEEPPLPDEPVPLSEATEFIYTGPDPIQTGVAPGTIEAERVAVIRGFAKSVSGDPVEGVQVSVPAHPELGATTTNADGELFLAVNGGATLAVRLEKAGYLPVDREVDVPWQDYVWIEDAVLTALDASATTVDLSSPIAPAQVARGSIETDANGSRQATLIFQTGTSAEMVMPNGTELPLEELTVRATEYTVGEDGPEAMPAELPPTSGYTYAAEYSVDEAIAAGATEVRFSQPVANYTENFLDFPVGSAVPTGYYDRERGVWVAAPNGRVVEILTESGGTVELDVSGSGQPASAPELQGLGVTSEELTELADLYEPGDSLWRVQMDHFTPWDHNWPFGAPPDAIPPDWDPPGPPVEESCTSGGSVIECENQVLGEDLPITGSEMGLHYRSDRVPGRRARAVEIRLAGPSLPPSVAKIKLSVDVAGQRFRQDFTPQPNLTHTFEWNGRDAFGRRLNGGQVARIQVDYEYELVRYADPAPFERAFGRMTGNPFASRDRGSVSMGQTAEVYLGAYEPPSAELGGWTLGEHHRYDPTARVIYLGDGRRRNAENIGSVAKRIAGRLNDGGESDGDGGPARDARMDTPEDVAVGPDGSVYFLDSNNARIRKIDPAGTVHTVVGTGEFRDYGSPAGDGGPATEAELDYPYGLDVGPDGSLYFSDWNRVRKVDPSGTISTVAGKEEDPFTDPAFSGDGGPATEAYFNTPDAVAIAPDGSLYIADHYNHRVRQVGTDGIVTTVAGSGPSGSHAGAFAGDGGPAMEARLNAPEDVEVDDDGAVYIADTGNERVRRVGPDGFIDTVAGNGSENDPPEFGVPATTSVVDGPMGLALDSEDRLLISFDRAVARVDFDGILLEVVGPTCPGPDCVDTVDDDGELAAKADLGCPRGLASGPLDVVYVSDVCGQTIRAVEKALPAFAADDIAIPSDDGSEIYVFDAAGRHLQTLDSLTGATRYTFSYDSAGRLASIEDGDGLDTTLERDGAGALTAIVAPLGRRTAVTTGPAGYLSTLTNPAGEETAFGYGPSGLLQSLTTPEGQPTTFEYDGNGKLIRDTDPAGGFKELSPHKVDDDEFEVTLETKLARASTYGVKRLPDDEIRRTWTDPSGLDRTRLVHNDGLIVDSGANGVTREVTTEPDPRFGMQTPRHGGVTETPGGRRMEIHSGYEAPLADPDDPLSLTSFEESVEVNGRTSTTVFDAALSTFTTTSPTGRSSTATVDSQRRPTQSAVPGLTPVTYGRDSLGRVETIAQGARTTGFAYDTAGRLETITDALDREHGFEYDAADRVVKEVLPDLSEVTFAYDDDGNLTSVTPPSRPGHLFAHTPIGAVGSYTPPELGSGPQPTVFDWSDDRELTKVTRPGGREVDFGYDSGGRLESVTQARGTTELDYHPQTGNPASATAPGGEQTSFSFDGFLPLGETQTGTVAGAVTRSFDDDFQVVSESVNGSHAAAFAYDDDGLLTSAGALSLDRNVQNGLLTGTDLGQVATTVDRNAFGEPETVSSVDGAATVLYEEDYERDDLGRITEKTERRGAQATTYEYGYDSAGRLETVTEDGQLAATYGYDANGNRTGVTRSGELPLIAQYDDQDRLESHGTATFAHDAAGYLTSKTVGSDTTAYEYDDLGALTEVTLPNGDDLDYAIDAAGRRIAKKRNGQIEQAFLYGQSSAPLAELNPNGTVKSRFVYATRSNVPDYMVRAGQTYRILTDQLGSPRAVVEVASGVVAQEIDYDEFGRVTRDTSPGFQPFGFAGGLYDQDTKLLRFGARDYDAETGRWTAKDPIGFAGGDTNLYGYVLSDPVNWSDPSGLFSLPGLDDISDFAAGFGDAVTEPLGLIGLPTTASIRRNLGWDNADYCSGAYGVGELAGLGTSFVAGPEAVAVTAGRSLVGAAALGAMDTSKVANAIFASRRGINNNNFIRLGEGYAPGGRRVFRGATSKPRRPMHWHLDADVPAWMRR